MSKVLKNFRVIKSKIQPKNRKCILCKSSFSNSNLNTVRKCPDQRCGICPYLKEGNNFKIEDREFKYYIGETGTAPRTRIRVHNQQIQHQEYYKIKASEHLDICGKGRFTVNPLYKFYSDNKVERREKEKYFISNHH